MTLGEKLTIECLVVMLPRRVVARVRIPAGHPVTLVVYIDIACRGTADGEHLKKIRAVPNGDSAREAIIFDHDLDVSRFLATQNSTTKIELYGSARLGRGMPGYRGPLAENFSEVAKSSAPEVCVIGA